MPIIDTYTINHDGKIDLYQGDPFIGGRGLKDSVITVVFPDGTIMETDVFYSDHYKDYLWDIVVPDELRNNLRLESEIRVYQTEPLKSISEAKRVPIVIKPL